MASTLGVAYVADSAPWGTSNPTTAMNDVFGQGNWTNTNFTDLNLSDFKAVWLDGSDGNSAFPAWMAAHQTELQDWVTAGGRVFINAAPNYGPISIDLGFNLTLTNGAGTYSDHVTLTADGQAALSGNNAGSSFTGGSFGHAILTDTVNPADMITWIQGEDGVGQATGAVLVFEHWGSGFVVAGGTTEPLFWSAVTPGDPQALLDNIVGTAIGAPAIIDSNGSGDTANAFLSESSTHVTDVHASAVGVVTYAIAGGADAALFQIDAATGSLSFVTAPNFEAPTDTGADNVYDVTVSAHAGWTTDTQALAITVTNVNEGNTIDSNGGGATASVSVDENTSAVTTVHATDIDAGTTLAYSITGGADAALFQIDASTGDLTFVSAPNFEAPADAGADNVYDVTVKASDGALTSSQDIAVTVGNVNEAPVIDSNGGGATASVSNDENAYAVTTVHAADADAGTTLTYSITGGADAAQFHIDAATGALSFISAPNFEAPTDAGGDNVYDVSVKASDGSLTSSQDISVTVGDVTNETLLGTPKSDTLTTEDGNDIIKGLASDDTLVSGAGNDQLDGGRGADQMAGGTGDDTYTVDNVGDVVVENAGEGTDTIRASISITALTANVENLTLIGTGNIDGTGSAGDNVIKGNSGNNMLRGLGGDDILNGGAGNDLLNGGRGADHMAGGAGNDTYIIDSVDDRVNEDAGQGTDTIRSLVSIEALNANVENLTLLGRSDLDGTGNDLHNVVRGNNGDNQLFGLGANDTLIGGLGNDTLAGGLGRDKLIGGAGQDTFLFDSALNSHTNVDWLTDFAASGVDNIQLNQAVFTAFTHTGSLTGDEFYAAAGAHSAHDASDRIIYDTTTGKLFYDADGIGGAAAVLFATLGEGTHPQLVFSDIAIYA